jgi:hypothetical protein
MAQRIERALENSESAEVVSLAAKKRNSVVIDEPPWWKPFLRARYPLAKVHDYAEVMRLYRSVINEGREWARTNFSERQVK